MAFKYIVLLNYFWNRPIDNDTLFVSLLLTSSIKMVNLSQWVKQYWYTTIKFILCLFFYFLSLMPIFCSRISSKILTFNCHVSLATLDCDNFSDFLCFSWLWGVLVRCFIKYSSIGFYLILFSWLDKSYVFLEGRLQR